MMRAMLMVAGLAWLAGACGRAAPHLSLGQTEIDLGTVRVGEVLNLEIPVTNLGQRDLVIEAVTTSCGCTQASVDPQVIPGGGQANLKVTFDSGAHGEAELGPIVRQVFIASNDPDEPEVEFRFSAVLVAASP